MLSAQFNRENPEVVRKAVRDRNTDAPIDRILELDKARRALLQQDEELKAERNALGRSVGRASAAVREQLLLRGKLLSERIDGFDAGLRAVDAELNALLLEVPNIPDADVPVAPDESGNVVVRQVGEPRAFDFEPKPHWDLGEQLGLIDFERGAKLAGSRFYVLKGPAARLQRALITFMLDLHVREHGYEELYLPYVMREENLVRSGHLPKFRESLYHDAEDDFWLIPTAEAPIANYHAGELIDEAALPIRYVAYTACFRREKMSAGRDVRGIKRGHQFDKVEMFRFCLPSESEEHLWAMVADAEDVLRRLGLTYRLLQLCTGDLDFKATKSFDLEVWAPGSKEWLEVSSASNCGDFQARRANVRYRPAGDGGRPAAPRFPHMLNASGVALPRLLAAILENGQREDGGIVLPEALTAFYGADLMIKPAKSS